MAEENPHIEIKKLPKPIENTREQYLFENENLILGRPGFTFRSYPTLKERLQESLREQKEYNFNISKMSRNNSLSKVIYKNIFNNDINAKSLTRNNSEILKRNSQTHTIFQPILRFKNRTDLERICDTIEKIAPQNELMSLKEIRSRHVNSIDFSKGSLSTKNISTSQNNLNSSNLTIRNINNNNNIVDEQKVNNIKIIKKPKIYFNRLQRLNAEAKK
jgi:hypothetical protein